MPILQSEILLSQRLKVFIEVCYQTQRNFSVITEIDSNTLSRYINNKISPSLDNFTKFQKAGLSLDWLIGGIGDMFADNHKGKKLSQIQSLNVFSKNKVMIKLRIEQWINENYTSIEHFSSLTNYSSNLINEILFGTKLLEPKFLSILCDYGCSMEWLTTGKGNPYHELSKGREKSYTKEKYSDSTLSNNGISKKDNYNLTNISEELKHDLKNNKVNKP